MPRRDEEDDLVLGETGCGQTFAVLRLRLALQESQVDVAPGQGIQQFPLRRGDAHGNTDVRGTAPEGSQHPGQQVHAHRVAGAYGQVPAESVFELPDILPGRLGGALWVTFGLQVPVLSHTVLVEEAFKDVPENHWAANAVVQIAVARGLMKGFPDDTFRGEAPFTRARFAVSLEALIFELEERSKTSWKSGSPAKATLSDVGSANPDRETILSLVNDYQLWDGVPAVDPESFRPDETVTRSEVAQVVRNLLASGEKLGVVLAGGAFRCPTCGRPPRAVASSSGSGNAPTGGRPSS